MQDYGKENQLQLVSPPQILIKIAKLVSFFIITDWYTKLGYFSISMVYLLSSVLGSTELRIHIIPWALKVHMFLI